MRGGVCAHYQTFEEAQARLQTFLEDVYDAKCLHSSLEYVPPDEFEANYFMCWCRGGMDFTGALHQRVAVSNAVKFTVMALVSVCADHCRKGSLPAPVGMNMKPLLDCHHQLSFLGW